MLICFVLTGCTTATIQTNKAPAFDEKINRVFLIIDPSLEGNSFISHLASQLKTQFKKEGVELGFYNPDPLSLAPQDTLEKRMEAFNADVRMVISRPEGISGTGEQGERLASLEGRMSLDVKLFPVEETLPVWRAKLNASGVFGLEPASIKAARRIIDSLAADEIL